jgi:hypothetical protein
MGSAEPAEIELRRGKRENFGQRECEEQLGNTKQSLVERA